MWFGSRAAVTLIIPLAIAACSAGGPDSPASTPPPPTGPAPSPVLQVLPTTYDFGKVTPGNEPAALEVTVANTGTAALNVSNIGIGTDPSFALVLSGGSKPCGLAPYNIAPGDRCTVQVTFKPLASGSFAANLQVNSSGGSPVVVPIGGKAEAVASITVRINQLQTACPSNEVTAFVSVTDQGGFPVTGLQASNFSVTQETTSRPVLSLSYVDLAYRPIAIVAGALDFSESLTDQPVAFADMKSGFSAFFGSMRAGDARRGRQVRIRGRSDADVHDRQGGAQRGNLGPFQQGRHDQAVRRDHSGDERHCAHVAGRFAKP